MRERVVGLRVRSNYAKRVGSNPSSKLHADLDVGIGSQHRNDCNDSLGESDACNDVRTACAPDDIGVLRASNVQDRRGSSSHFSRLDDRERRQ